MNNLFQYHNNLNIPWKNPCIYRMMYVYSLVVEYSKKIMLYSLDIKSNKKPIWHELCVLINFIVGISSGTNKFRNIIQYQILLSQLCAMNNLKCLIENTTQFTYLNTMVASTCIFGQKHSFDI